MFHLEFKKKKKINRNKFIMQINVPMMNGNINY